MPRELMIGLREDMDRASSARSIESLLGIEGAAASRYFQNSDFIRAAGSCNLTDSGRKRFIAAFERRMTQEVTHPGIGLPVGCER
jgi:CRISPR/Cas system-associated endonuclease Cas1